MLVHAVIQDAAESSAIITVVFELLLVQLDLTLYFIFNERSLHSASVALLLFLDLVFKFRILLNIGFELKSLSWSNYFAIIIKNLSQLPA